MSAFMTKHIRLCQMCRKFCVSFSDCCLDRRNGRFPIMQGWYNGFSQPRPRIRHAASKRENCSLRTFKRMAFITFPAPLTEASVINRLGESSVCLSYYTLYGEGTCAGRSCIGRESRRREAFWQSLFGLPDPYKKSYAIRRTHFCIKRAAS